MLFKLENTKKSFCFSALLIIVLSIFIAKSVNVSAASDTSTTVISIKNRTYKLEATLDSSVNGEISTSELYRLTNNGYKKVASKNIYLCYACTYGNKIYFNYKDTGETKLYCYSIGDTKIKKVKNINIYYAKGKYAIGCKWEPTDIGPIPLCLYNISTGKITSLGYGYLAWTADYTAVKLFSGKIRYLKLNSDYTSCKIISCSLNGKNKKVLKTYSDPDGILGVKIYQNYFTYYNFLSIEMKKVLY